MNLLQQAVRVSLPLLAAMSSAVFVAPARSADTPTDPAFEKPAAVRHLRLGPADTKPISYKEIRCSYYAGIVIKERDEREIGDKQISYILAPGSTKPACQKAALPGRGDKKACLAKQMSRRAEWDKSPSVIAFAATAVLGPGDGATVSPAVDPVQCWPSD
jgi:hypothetical protein